MSAQIMKRERSSLQRGNTLFAVTQPAWRGFWFWSFAIGSLMMGCVAAVDAVDPDSPDRVLRTTSAVGHMLLAAMWLFIIWKQQHVPIVTFTDEGFVVGNALGEDGAFIPWSRVRRWTWNNIPHLQLNLFDGNCVFNFPIPAALREPVDEILRSRIMPAQQPTTGVMPESE
ncbi:MAG: hypothetical protein U0795_00555 [Pirellulales bacterium]